MKKNAMRGGAYSAAVTAVVLAILIAVNVFVSAMPSGATEYDISASKLYSVTSNTKSVVNALTEDVTIYWIVQADEEDDVIGKLLDRYESLSDHITVEKRNPDVYPTFAEQYTDGTVYNNSLVVECGDRSRYIGYEDIYLTDASMYSYSYSTSFDGEGAITSAIDYVTNPDQPVVYTLTGHGEEDLPATFADSLEKENITVEDLSLLNTAEIPEDAACLIVYAPQSDISEAERDTLASYVAGDGRLLVMAGPVEAAGLPNFYSLLEPFAGVNGSGANVNFTMNALSQLIGESETLSIRTKSLNYNYLTISDSVSGLLQVVMIGLIPLAFLGTGIILVVRRRRLLK